ncbi:hypothetical protein C8J56DRAFT_898659 [Mycena floridula]|nr:hypothetical protein C8J56DRAFT_898659 [Mycena floridula]
MANQQVQGAYVLLALLAMHTLLVLFCLKVASTFTLLIGVLVENPELKLQDRIDIANASIDQVSLAELWVAGSLDSLQFMFGDAIVVWRTWAVWHDQQSVIILPVLTLLATFVFLQPSSLYGKIANLQIAGSIMSIITNLIAVILIGVKTYQHWQFMKDTIGQGNSVAGKVLMFLTESGVVYIVLQIITFCLIIHGNIPLNNLNAANIIWSGTINMLLTQSLVILIVNNQHSIAHITEVSYAGDQNLGTHISFARSGLPETTDSTASQTDPAVPSISERHYDTEKIPEV